MRTAILVLVLVTACTTSRTAGQLAPSPTAQAGAEKANRPPQIQGDIEVYPRHLTPEGIGVARVNALDPDKQELQYLWSVTGGEILEGADQPTVTFRAAEDVEQVTLRVAVTDEQNMTATKSRTIPLVASFLLFETPPEPEVWKKGETLPVWLHTRNTKGLYSFAFVLRYPETKVEVLRVQAGPALGEKPVLVLDRGTPGKLGIAVTRADGEPIQSNATALLIVFRAREEIPEPRLDALLQLELSEDLPIAKDAQGKEVAVGYRVRGKPPEQKANQKEEETANAKEDSQQDRQEVRPGSEA